MSSGLQQICIDKLHSTEQGESMTEVHHFKSLETSNREKGAGRKCITDAERNVLSSSSRSFHGKSLTHWVLMFASSLAVIVGAASATLLGRLYFVHGGSHRWLYTWTQSVAWPILLVPLLIGYQQQSVRPTRFTPKLLVIYVGMGIMTAFDNLLYSWGLSFLPASTNALLCSSQLAFTAIFAFALVRKKLSAFTLNSVFIITMSAVMLAVRGSSDRPAGTSEKQYNLGFVVTIAASAIYALILTLTELIYRKIVGKANFLVVLEVQMCIAAAATLLTMVGMWIVGDFRSIHHEASHFDLGSTVYALVLIWSAIGWQLFFLGSAAIIFLTSSLMACILTTVTIPLIPILAVFFFKETFSALKAMSMLMCIWGFTSYIYGGYLESKERTKVLQDTRV